MRFDYFLKVRKWNDMNFTQQSHRWAKKKSPAESTSSSKNRDWVRASLLTTITARFITTIAGIERVIKCTLNGILRALEMMIILNTHKNPSHFLERNINAMFRQIGRQRRRFILWTFSLQIVSIYRIKKRHEWHTWRSPMTRRKCIVFVVVVAAAAATVAYVKVVAGAKIENSGRIIHKFWSKMSFLGFAFFISRGCWGCMRRQQWVVSSLTHSVIHWRMD